MKYNISNILLFAGATLATPLIGRQVNELNQEAFEEAHKRDDTATRAFSSVAIKTSDGRCLSVDKLSGDFRANLTPVQVVDCGTTDGESWDIITSGVHNNRNGQMLVVSTLTQACLNFDPRRAAGNQVLLFSCGGRADGSGEVTESQLFAFNGSAGPLTLTPGNANGQCVTSDGNALGIAACVNGNRDQSFTIGGAPSEGNAGGDPASSKPAASKNPVQGTPTVSEAPVQDTRVPEAPVQDTPPTTAAPKPVRTKIRKSKKHRKHRKTRCSVTAGVATETSSVATSSTPEVVAVTTTAPDEETSTTAASTEASTGTATERVPVSRAGGFLDPSAAAEAQQFDKTATRLIESVNIRAPDGRCLFVDPTAGDFRENLIPIELRKCDEEPGQKFDLISKGKHNNGDAGRVLLSSVLTNGCISFDNRRPAGDTVTIFSCGGRANGEGETDNAQLYPFKEDDIPETPVDTLNIVLEPLSGNDKFCLVAGKDRLESTSCNGAASQVFEIVEVL
ncbi:hypothetical protein NLU13_4622 [Sarocladium strictum]|uniref:Ricin B lectin domain-containing protein n=1 Tax=Sarocladium strictum TaxID=5046 RepID=A0AA39GLU0_SARSR|nr:hypothetical protein NLU13_4622 [Sarocladium strictum]